MRLPIETENPLFGDIKYPQAKEIMESQQDKTWTAQEIAVKKDLPDYQVHMSPAQFNLVSVTLQSFVEVEQKVGDVWDEIAKWYPHSEIEGACAEIARMEKSVHAFFYQKMSDELNILPETVAKNQREIGVILSKLNFLKKVTTNMSANKPLTLATISGLEQVLLFSNFGMLKSFKSNGHNFIPNTLHGVDYAISDETLHGDFSSYLFQTVISEDMEHGQSIDRDQLQKDVFTVFTEIVEHEDDIIDFSYQDEVSINGVLKDDLKEFIRSRANDTLVTLGYEPLYPEITDTVIGKWFYQGISGLKSHDFFNAGTNQYKRTWNFEGFSLLPHLKEDNV